MTGRFNGCQAIISHEQPLALFFHCAAHSANLTNEHTAESCSLVRNALQTVNELGVLFIYLFIYLLFKSYVIVQIKVEKINVKNAYKQLTNRN